MSSEAAVEWLERATWEEREQYFISAYSPYGHGPSSKGWDAGRDVTEDFR